MIGLLRLIQQPLQLIRQHLHLVVLRLDLVLQLQELVVVLVLQLLRKLLHSQELVLSNAVLVFQLLDVIHLLL